MQMLQHVSLYFSACQKRQRWMMVGRKGAKSLATELLSVIFKVSEPGTKKLQILHVAELEEGRIGDLRQCSSETTICVSGME